MMKAFLLLLILTGCALFQTPATDNDFRPGEIWPINATIETAEEVYWRNQLLRARRRVAVCERLLNAAQDDMMFCQLRLRELLALKP